MATGHGCLKFSKQTKNIHYYPRIRIGLRDTIFSEEIGILLRSRFNVGSWKSYRFNGLQNYEISGKDNLEKWMRTIGSNNTVRKTKYLIWKKRGFYIPKSSLASRVKALSLNTV